MTEHLYGTDIDDEYLHADADDAIEYFAEFLGRERIPFVGTLHRHTIAEPGDSIANKIPDGRTIVERVAEDFADDCGFEELAENYIDAACYDDVIAAFQAARDLLVSKQRFRIADRLDAKASFTIAAIDDDGVPTYTIGEWEPA